eukprot:scaffold7204_cov102-Isochrysis_galbana.AAC.1
MALGDLGGAEAALREARADDPGTAAILAKVPSPLLPDGPPASRAPGAPRTSPGNGGRPHAPSSAPRGGGEVLNWGWASHPWPCCGGRTTCLPLRRRLPVGLLSVTPHAPCASAHGDIPPLGLARADPAALAPPARTAHPYVRHSRM